MNRNRKHRLNLSLVRKSESPKSPAPDRNRMSVETNPSATECNSPIVSRKRSSTFSDGSPVMNDYDNSPILMSQDTSNMVTGVSWAWNSPKRTIPDEHRPRPRPLLVSNNINPPVRETKLHKQATERLVGFYKFQMELQKIQTESSKEDGNKTANAKPYLPQSPDHTDLFDSFSESEANDVEPPVVEQRTTVHSPPYKEVIQMDSFNDSAFDSLLLQASQAAEKKSHQNQLDVVTNIAAASSEKTPNKRRSFFKSRTINDLDSFAMNDLLNDSVDFCLIEASQMVEGTVELKNHDQKTADPTGSKKMNITLTRHKSMPASPSQKVNSQNNSDATSVPLRAKFDANFQKSEKSSSSAANFPSRPEPSQHPPRLCTKEEIEQKRQEALKRQQARLNRLGALSNNGLKNSHLSNVKRS